MKKEDNGTKVCKHCNSDIPKKVKACPNCGKKVSNNSKWVVIALIIVGLLVFVGNGGSKKPKVLEDYPGLVIDNDSNMTEGQKNALASAKAYLNSVTFSYEGLVKQLEYENFSHEEAVYAADNCGADWNEQALKSAKLYLNFSAFSYSGLVNQLEYDNYTPEQAKYGVDNCGADWNEQAAKKAKEYLDNMSFSRDGLIEQLEFEGFTSEEAEYGVSQAGY